MITIHVENSESPAMQDFADFIEILIGSVDNIQYQARLFRNGVTNAADRGLDMWANFGPVVQVKHVSLTQSLAESISESVSAENILIVCKTAEIEIMKSIVNQIGLRIKGVISQSELEKWYATCLTKYPDTMGIWLLNYLRDEFSNEFAYVTELDPFLQERGYTIDQLTGEDQV